MIGSLLVVAVSLIPLVIGGPIFGLFMIVLGVVGYREYLELVTRVSTARSGPESRVGYVIVAALGCTALLDAMAISLLSIAFLAVVVPLVALFRRPTHPGGFSNWAFVSTGSLYLGLPVYAAVGTRASPGAIDAAWLSEIARRFAFTWEPAPVG